MLSDNGREFCGHEDQHPYELFLRLEGIEHKRTRVKRPQSNGIVEDRRTWLETMEENMNGRTPAKAFIDGLPKATTLPTSKPHKAA